MSSPRTAPRYPRGKKRAEFARQLAERFTDDPVPVQDLAAQVGRTPTYVRRLLEEAGVETDDESCLGLSAEALTAALVQRYDSGVSIERLSRNTGIDRRRIQRLLRQQSITIRTHRPFPTDQIPVAERQYLQGASLADIATLTGSSKSTVRRTLLDAGITLREPGGTHSTGGYVATTKDQ